MIGHSHYKKLETYYRRLGNIAGAEAMLHWDWATIMPNGGAESRAAQLSELSLIRHECLINPELEELLDEAESNRQSLEPWQNANLREMRHCWLHANALPTELVGKLSKSSSHCEMIWRSAKKDNDLEKFYSAFEPLLILIREKAAIKSEVLGLEPYDALIDSYDPGFRVIEIDSIFDQLKNFLPEFVQLVHHHQAEKTQPIKPKGPFSIEAQSLLARQLSEQLGFNFDYGRIDTSHHPFCGGTPDDVRITTSYHEEDFTRSLMAILHETGHALYERGLPREWYGQPVGEACSMSMHESQSLLIEMQVCRSFEFFKFVAPLVFKAFSNGSPSDTVMYSDTNLHKLALKVDPGCIRIDADEVTYPLHIMLRYDLEKAMISNDLKVSDLAGAWQEGMERYLGIVPKTHSEGCLQDIHWSTGDIGYFPSYTLGALIAAQLFSFIRTRFGSLSHDIRNGRFSELVSWLKDEIHSKASLYSTQDLVARVTGEPLGIKAFKAHLNERYLS